jgi:hypothetical protein
MPHLSRSGLLKESLIDVCDDGRTGLRVIDAPNMPILVRPTYLTTVMFAEKRSIASF